MHCELVEPGSNAWTEVLRETRHDFYHLPAYARICAAQQTGAVPRAFVARDEEGMFLIPFLIRPIGADHVSSPIRDAVTPYAYSSPLVKVRTGCDSKRFLDRAIHALVERLSGEQIISLFVRLHPLLPIPLEPLQSTGVLVEHGETVYIDLSRSHEELMAATEKKERQKLRRAQKDGFVAEIDDEWDSLEDFEEIYAQTMYRVDASPEYFFGHDYFTALRDDLGDFMHLVVVRHEDTVVSGAIVSEISSIVQFHILARRDGFEKSNAPRLSVDFARSRFKDRGNQFLHLGGGVGGRADSVFEFKSRFSNDRAIFRTWRLIVDPTAYRRLVQDWEAETGAISAGRCGYFPEYRAPLPNCVQ